VIGSPLKLRRLPAGRGELGEFPEVLNGGRLVEIIPATVTQRFSCLAYSRNRRANAARRVCQ